MSFERWTERARQVIVLAQEAARRLGHGYIGTEHLLHGLSAEGEGIAAKVLREVGLTPEKIEEAVESIVGLGTNEPTAAPVPFTSRAKKVIELSLREALALGCNYIGTEHVLLGLVRENEGVGARVLEEASLDSEGIRNAVIRHLSGPARPTVGELVYTLELTTGKPGEGGYTCKLRVGDDEFAEAHAATRNLALEAIIPYVLSTEGFPTDSMDDPIEGLSLRQRILNRKNLAA